jgi:hypothetical protein
MKLVVKLPLNKPPFIGIVFHHSSDAEQTHQDLVTVHNNVTYQVVFEFVGQLVNIKLISVHKVVSKHYEGVTFNAVELFHWMCHTSNTGSFNFGHLYELNGKEVVAKTSIGLKLFVIRVYEYEVLLSESSS